jgi:hypothetical protein
MMFRFDRGIETKYVRTAKAMSGAPPSSLTGQIFRSPIPHSSAIIATGLSFKFALASAPAARESKVVVGGILS